VTNTHTIRRAKHESRGRRATKTPWWEMIKEDGAMSRQEAQTQKQTEAVLKERVTGMKKIRKSIRWEKRHWSELAAAEPDSRTIQSREARRAAFLGKPSRGMRLGKEGGADEKMRLPGGQKIKEWKDKGEQACTDRTLGRCCRTAPKGSAKEVRKQGVLCKRSDKSGGEKGNCCSKRRGRSWGADDDSGGPGGATSIVWPQQPKGSTLRIANADSDRHWFTPRCL